MSRLSKQQQRRIVAQRENRLAAQEAENIATVVCHLGYHLVLEREGVLFAADWRRQSGDVVCNDQVLAKPLSTFELSLRRSVSLGRFRSRFLVYGLSFR